MKFLRPSLRACLLSLALLSPGPVMAEPDVLLRPALLSARAQSAAILAVGHAGSRLVAAGERGIILLSDDQGRSWRQAPCPVSVSLTAISFASPRDGWVVGHSGVVLHTSDGGEHWVLQFDGKRAADVAVSAAGIATGPDAERLRKEAAELRADGPDKPFLDVWFRDVRHGLIIGAYGLFFATDDGGATWQDWHDRLANPEGKHLYAFDAIAGDLTIVGEQGAMFRSVDEGQHFAAVQTPYDGSFFGIVHTHADTELAFGLRGNVYRAVGGGQDWQHVAMPAGETINAGAVLDDGAILLLDQAGHVAVSHDDGATFAPVAVPRLPPLTSATETDDHAVVLGSLAGPVRLERTLLESK